MQVQCYSVTTPTQGMPGKMHCPLACHVDADALTFCEGLPGKIEAAKLAVDTKQDSLASAPQETSNRGVETAAEYIPASGQTGQATAGNFASVIENGGSQQKILQSQGLGSRCR